MFLENVFFRRLFVFYSLLLFPVSVGAQSGSEEETFVTPNSEKGKYHMRAVWLTTIYGLDWPSTTARNQSDEERQKAELVSILDDLQYIGVNTVYLQVRSRGRLIYPSDLEPLSSDFVPSNSIYQLGYDPLEFAIQECHKRGMSLHAWLVVLPLGSDAEVRAMPKWCYPRSSTDGVVHYNRYWYMDPGSPRTWTHLRAIVRELVERYRVSGIHLDYIRYPDRSKGFPDQMAFSRSMFTHISDFRRANINKVVAEIAHELASDSIVIGYKPFLSAAVVGRYRRGEQSTKGEWTAYDSVYQDPVAWAKAGTIDFVVPMMYFKGGIFPSAFQQWKNSLNEVTDSCPIIAGLAPYMVDKREGNWHKEEVIEQVDFLDSIPVAYNFSQKSAVNTGVALFRAKHVLDSNLGVGELIAKRWLNSFPLPWQASVSHHLIPTQELEMQPLDNGLEISWKSTGSHKLYALYLTHNGEEPCGQSQPFISTTSTSVVIPWSEIGKESLIGCRVGVYDLVTNEEVIPIESAWFYNR